MTNICTNSPWCEPCERCCCEAYDKENSLKPLLKHHLVKEKKYYRIAGEAKDIIQFNSTKSIKQGYTNETKNIEQNGYRISTFK